MKRIVLALTALTLLGCEPAPQAQNLGPISFANQPKIRLAVSEIRVVEQYEPPMKSPNVEHIFHTTPSKAIGQWATDRLQAAGTQGLMEVSIEDASVVEVPLPKTEGLRGLFTDDQSERYDGKIRVTFRIFDGARAIAIAEGDVNVVRSRSVNEKATIQDRERMFHQMTQEMMTQFNGEAEKRLRQYFGAFLR
jgi:hypothetical protein